MRELASDLIAQVTRQDAKITQLDNQIGELDLQITQRDLQIASLDQTITSRDREILHRQAKIDQLPHVMAMLKALEVRAQPRTVRCGSEQSAGRNHRR